MTTLIVNIQKRILNEICKCYKLQDEIKKLKAENISLRHTFLKRREHIRNYK